LSGIRSGASAGAMGCMAAYNDIDGMPCHANRELLTDILREEMGFDGLVMSDGCGVDRLEPVVGSLEKAGAAAVHAGVDLNLWNDAFLKLEEAAASGLLDENDIDTAVRRILTVKFRLGLFENPYVDEAEVRRHVATENNRQTALEIAREVPVLLENRNSTLPLPDSVKSIAVIGPNSDTVLNQLGDYTSWQEEGRVITVLEGIRQEASAGCEVLSVQGCSVRGQDKSGFPEALEAATKADVTVLVLGGSSTREPGGNFADNGAMFMNDFTGEIDCGEGRDLADIRLGGVQEELALEIRKLNKPLVGVLIQGRPHAVPRLAKACDALLCGWYPGEQGGKAIAEILFGKTAPSGRLPVSIPRDSGQLPVYYNRKDIENYVDMSAEPLYPFGYGLSYSRFSLSDFRFDQERLSRSELMDGKKFRLHLKLTNSGDRAASEVVQLYIHDKESSVTRRNRELKDFQKTFLPPGGSRELTLELDAEALKVYDWKMNPVLEPGNITVMAGTASNCIHFEKDVQILP
ncbi:MAG: glycoside hydrolase family 3 C-terminal domain-containing protein, partial [Spirochaetales bacterium]|nr:glycoside hydrolase family 3 C-terminal domain-containing protein [Spirochaetales bacterium]